jgi:dolichol-phosphate mannosyltransferase
LKIRIKDPMSGFFLCRRHVLQDIDINTTGYKILLEILVKKQGLMVKEVPYTFVNRKLGQSKMNLNVIGDYLKAIWALYKYGRKSRQVYEKELAADLPLKLEYSGSQYQQDGFAG